MCPASRILAALVLCAAAPGARGQPPGGPPGGPPSGPPGGPPGGQAGVSCSGGNVSLSLGIYPSYNPAPADSSTALVVTCTRNGGAPDTTVTVGLGPSLNSGVISNRQTRLTTGSDLLNYNLYRDAARVSVWGETIGVDTVSQTISLANNTSGTLTFNIFARIDVLQDVRGGAYTDQVTITVTF